MDQATATAATASTTLPTDRASYQRAAALATRLVERLAVLPRAVETHADFTGHSIRLHFGTGITAGRGVLEVARIADAEADRDEASSCAGDWVECRTVIEGVPVVARALLTKADADTLLEQTPAPAAPAAQPVRLGASPVAQA